MKLNTAVIIAKGMAHLIIGVFTPWSAALAQWVNSGTWPERIIWIGILLPASAVGGASAVLAFLSGSFTEYRAQKIADDTQRTVVLQTDPVPPKVEPPIKTP